MSKKQFAFLVLAIIGFFSNGCTQEAARVVASDPVSQFKAIVKPMKSPVSWETKEKDGCVITVNLDGMKYDVKKTDSLVTPYAAEMHFRLSIKHPQGFTLSEDLVRRYGYQDGGWVLIGTYRYLPELGKEIKVDATTKVKEFAEKCLTH